MINNFLIRLQGFWSFSLTMEQRKEGRKMKREDARERKRDPATQ